MRERCGDFMGEYERMIVVDFVTDKTIGGSKQDRSADVSSSATTVSAVRQF